MMEETQMNPRPFTDNIAIMGADMYYIHTMLVWNIFSGLWYEFSALSYHGQTDTSLNHHKNETNTLHIRTLTSKFPHPYGNAGHTERDIYHNCYNVCRDQQRFTCTY